MLNTDEVISLLVGNKCPFRRIRDGQLYGAWVLQELLSGGVTAELLKPSRAFRAPPINVIEAVLLAREDWSEIFKLIDAEFHIVCEGLAGADLTKSDHRSFGDPVALCHNALIAAMEACCYQADYTALAPENEKQFFDFLITTSFGKYSKVMEFDKEYSGRMSNCSGKLITLESANEYFAVLQDSEKKMMSGCGKQIASEFCIKRFANMPLPSKILVCAPQPTGKTRKK